MSADQKFVWWILAIVGAVLFGAGVWSMNPAMLVAAGWCGGACHLAIEAYGWRKGATR